MRGFYRHFTVFSIKTAIVILPIDGPMYLYIRVKSGKIIVSLKENTNRRQIMKKRIFAFIIALIMVAVLIPAASGAVEGDYAGKRHFAHQRRPLENR